MASAVSRLLNGFEATNLSLSNPLAAADPIASQRHMHHTKKQEFLEEQIDAIEAAKDQPWRSSDYRPTTRSVVEAVKSLNVNDVKWFLHELDLYKNGGDSKKVVLPPPPTPSTSAATPRSSASAKSTASTGASSSAPPPNVASSNSRSVPASSASTIASADGPSAITASLPPLSTTPSPFLSTLSADALQLPTSAPYILDMLFDTIVGIQSRCELREIQKVKQANAEKATADGVDVSLIDLLTPLPPVEKPSITLPAPSSEYAFQILQALVEAVDVVGVNVLSKAAAIDYLKMCDVPYPISKTSENGVPISPTNAVSISSSESDEWTVTKEWKKRVKYLKQWGAVLDVESILDAVGNDSDSASSKKRWSRKNTAEDEGEVNEDKKEESSMKRPPALRLRSYSSSNSPVDSPPNYIPTTAVPTAIVDVTVPPNVTPTLSDYLIPPFVTTSRVSQEKYLQHTYLLLLEKRQMFLKLVTEVLAKVRNTRAASNYQLGLIKAESEKRDAKILTDLKSFEDALSKVNEASEGARSAEAVDRSKTDALDKSAMQVRKVEWEAHRQAVATKGARLIKQASTELEAELAELQAHYIKVRNQGREGLSAVEEARASLGKINQTYDKLSLQLESKEKLNEAARVRTGNMERYVSSLETSVKAAKKALKETQVLVEKSRAAAAATQVVEFEMSGKGISLIFATSITGVSNLFLKFFRCMSGAPDPNDPAPEVVWSPEACMVTELCSPNERRTILQVANPVWRTVKLDLWKLCEGEYDRYFKVEVWDCDASVRQVQSVVKGAIEQAKIENEQKAKAAAAAESESVAPPQEFAPDGTPIAPPTPAPAPAVPASVTLPSTSAIKYQYIGQSVCTLNHLIQAQQKQDAAAAAASSSAPAAPTLGLLTLPVINADKWNARSSVSPYSDSGTLIFNSFKIKEAE